MRLFLVLIFCGQLITLPHKHKQNGIAEKGGHHKQIKIRHLYHVVKKYKYQFKGTDTKKCRIEFDPVFGEAVNTQQ